MSRYLAHAITRRVTGGPGVGLRGLPLRWIQSGELGLWATEWSGDPALERADVFAHHDLVAALCAAGPCLPVRFGTWLANEAVARRSVEEGEARFIAAVDRLSDRQEVAVTLLWTSGPAQAQPGLAAPAPDEPLSTGAAPDATPTPGRSFLDRKRSIHAVTDDRRRTAEAFAARLTAELAGDQADVRQETCPSDEVALSLSLLALRNEAGALKARATLAVAKLADVRGVVSGPWPPYSFTEDLAVTNAP